jgi:hypothetical protein
MPILRVDESAGLLLHEHGAPGGGSRRGNTQASRVILVVRFSEVAAGIVTKLEPLKTKALLNLPCVLQVTPLLSVPLLLPEASVTVVPEVSLKP